MNIDVRSIVEAVASSRRYRHVAPAMVARLAGEEAPKSRNPAEAEKRTKRRLHQVFGAYASPIAYDKALAELRAAGGEAAAFRAACARVMRGHASTAERLADLDEFYERIFAVTGRPG